ncbi:hypothetical protein [Fibrobacter sp.]|uniref:hypothetical protein n=1 Tax=Fibrobacter sp. TaxID=35828 RepID=UPI00388F1B6A
MESNVPCFTEISEEELDDITPPDDETKFSDEELNGMIPSEDKTVFSTEELIGTTFSEDEIKFSTTPELEGIEPKVADDICATSADDVGTKSDELGF